MIVVPMPLSWPRRITRFHVHRVLHLVSAELRAQDEAEAQALPICRRSFDETTHIRPAVVSQITLSSLLTGDVESCKSLSRRASKEQSDTLAVPFPCLRTLP